MDAPSWQFKRSAAWPLLMAALTSETVLRFLILVVFVVVPSVTVIYLTLHHATADEVYDFVILGGLRRSRSQPSPQTQARPQTRARPQLQVQPQLQPRP